MIYPKSNRSLVDADLLAKIDDTYQDKLLQADNVFIKRNGNLTRRPPLVKRSFNFEPGEILDAKSTKDHYVILRKVEPTSLNPSSKAFGHVTFNQDRIQESYSFTHARRVPVNYSKPWLEGQSVAPLSTALDRSSDTYTFTPDSDLVAIDFYDKETGTLNKKYSKLFGIHKPKTSDIAGGNVKESNRLIATASGKETSLEGGENEAVLIGIYSNYTDATDVVEDLKYIPPLTIPLKTEIVGTGTFKLQDLLRSTGFICYRQDYIYQQLARNYIEQGEGHDLELENYEFISNSYKDANVKGINIYDDNVIFTFCGLGYVISKTGEINCIHSSQSKLPTIRQINQDTIRTYPLSREINKEPQIPIKIYLRKATEPDGAGSFRLEDEEEMTKEEFINKYPQYASIINRLTQVVSYVPLETLEGYSSDTFYCMPDIKFLVPTTDISSDCKYITKGDTPYDSAWFGVPTMREAYLSRKGWVTVTDDKKFPYDHGISAGGVGCSAALFRRDVTKEKSDTRSIKQEVETDNTGKEIVVETRVTPNNYIVPKYLDRAMKQIFEGQVIDVPQDYIDYIKTRVIEAPSTNDGTEESAEEPAQPTEESEDVKFGLLPSIPFYKDSYVVENVEGTITQLQEEVENDKRTLATRYKTLKSERVSTSLRQVKAAEDQLRRSEEKLNKQLYRNEGLIAFKELYTINDQMEQLDAYIHIELDYGSSEFNEFFNEKDLMCLPSSNGQAGYNFEILKKGGETARAGIESTTNYYSGAICSFENGLGYVMPLNYKQAESTELASVSNDWLRHFTMYKRINLLRNKPVAENMLLGSNAPPLFISRTKLSPIPLRFSAAGTSFPLSKARLTYTNVRNMFYAGNELSVSASEDLQANVFYEPLKYYFQYISNQSLSPIVFLEMGLYNQTLETNNETDPNFFKSVTKGGQADPIKEVILLDSQLIIHTEGGLSTITADFNLLNRFADIEITTNLIKDGTAIVGAKENKVYLTGYSHEKRGYAVEDVNKELRSIVPVDYIVDLLDAQRVALLFPEKGNVLYVLSQETDRRFKGFTRFILPIEVIHAFREDFNKVLLVDKNSNIYSMDFNTNRDTKYEDNYVDDDGNAQKSTILSRIRQTPLIAVDAESSTFFTEQTAGRLAIGIHGVPKMNLEYISEGKDKLFRKEIPFAVRPRSAPQTVEEQAAQYCTSKIKTTVKEKILCNTRQWKSDENVEAFGIDFSRQLILFLAQGKMKLRRLSDGQIASGLSVWGDYARKIGKDAVGIKDIKFRTDYSSNFVDYTPYIIDNEFNITALDYDADSNSMVEREVYSGSGNTKKFCFISDNIVAVLIDNIIKIVDIKRERDNELESIDLSEIIPGKTPLGIDSIESSYIIVTTQNAFYRIKISSKSLVRNDGLLFPDRLKDIIRDYVGCVYKDNGVYLFSNGLHKIKIESNSSGTRIIEGQPDTEIGATSETEDPPECATLQTPTRVTLIDGHTTSIGLVTTPVDTGTGDSPGNIAIDVGDRASSSIGSTSTLQVSPGEAGAFRIGAGNLKLSILTRSPDGDISNHPFTFTNASPPVFTAGSSETPHSSILDIKATFPADSDVYVVTGSAEVVLLSDGTAPENLNSPEMPESVSVASIQRDKILMINENRLFVFNYTSTEISKVNDITLTSSSGIITIFAKGNYIFLVRSNEIEAINSSDGSPANLFNGGTSNTISFKGTSAAYDNDYLWFLDGGKVKRNQFRILDRNIPGTEEITLTAPSGEEEIIDGGGRSGELPRVFDSSEDLQIRQGYKSKAPMFWSKIFKLDKDWNAIGSGILYSNGIAGIPKNHDQFSESLLYRLSATQIDRYNNYGVPAMPYPTYMFVDEYRVNADLSRPFFGGSGHFPECIAVDGDQLYIPFSEGDIVPYNIKDKNYGFNRGKYQIDPIMGSKLSYIVPFFVGTSSNSRYRFMPLFSLLDIRAGMVYNTAGVGDRNKVLRASGEPNYIGGYMGGVTAMTAFLFSNAINRFYGISKSYNKENGWESATTASTRAKNSGRKTGKILNNRLADGDREGVLSFDRKPYIIFESADFRDLTRSWPSGDARNNNVWDSNWNLTGGDGVDAQGNANAKKAQIFLGRATYAPSFKERSAQPGDADPNYYIGAYDDEHFQAILNGVSHRADPRYTYRILSSSRFPAGGKITCMFTDRTDLYVVIQPPQSGKARMWKIAIGDIKTRGFAPQSVSNYEDSGNWKRPIEKTTALMETGRWFEVRVETTDYGDMVANGQYDKMPHLQYFDSIDYDATNDLFVGTTAWSIYVFDKTFNFKVQKPLFLTRQPNSYEKGYHKALGLIDDKINAKCIDTKAKKIYLLKRHFEERNINHFWHHSDPSKTFITSWLDRQDRTYGGRAVNFRSREFNIGGAYRYLWNELTRKFEDLNKGGMSIPFVTKLEYNLTKRTTPRTTMKHIRVGGTQEVDVRLTILNPNPPKASILNIVSHDVSRGIIRTIAEDIDGTRYNKTAAVNINEGTGRRLPDLEVSVLESEKPIKIASLDGNVYIAVDDQKPSTVPPDDDEDDDDDDDGPGPDDDDDDDDDDDGPGPDDDDDDDDDDGPIATQSTYQLSHLCNGRTYNNVQLPELEDGYEWAFDTSGTGLGIFKKVRALSSSQITDTLVPVSRDGWIDVTRLSSSNRYHETAEGFVIPRLMVCRLIDSLKRRPPPPVTPCPTRGHSISLSQFCSRSRTINSECLVYEYNTENATGGVEPRVTGYPSGKRITVSQDVVQISSSGRITNGTGRFANYIRHRICSLPTALKKKYVPEPPTQNEYSLADACASGFELLPAESGKKWQFVTESTNNDIGKLVQNDSSSASNENAVDLQLRNDVISIHRNANLASNARYYRYRGRPLCTLPDALKRGTGPAGIETEYSLAEACRLRILSYPGAGKQWYYVTSSSNNNYGRFVISNAGERSTDNKVGVTNNLAVRENNPGVGSSRYFDHRETNPNNYTICNLPDALKRGTGGSDGPTTTRTEYSRNEICVQSMRLPAPPSGKKWYFVTSASNNNYGTFKLLNSSQDNDDHHVAIDAGEINPYISRSPTLKGRYTGYGPRGNMCKMPDSLQRGTGSSGGGVVQSEYSYNDICVRNVRLPNAPSGNTWFFVTSNRDNQYGKFEWIGTGNSQNDNRVKVEYNRSGTLQFASTASGRYRAYRGTAVCSMPLSLRLGTASQVISFSDVRSGSKSLSKPPSGTSWYFETTSSTSQEGSFRLKQSGLTLGDSRVEVDRYTTVKSNARGRYSRLKGTRATSFPFYLRVGATGGGGGGGGGGSLGSRCYRYQSQCESGDELPSTGGGRYWFYVIGPPADNRGAVCQMTRDEGFLDPQNRAEINADLTIVDNQINRTHRFKDYVGQSICYLPNILKEYESDISDLIEYDLEYLCTVDIRFRGKVLPGKLGTLHNVEWYYETLRDGPRIYPENRRTSLNENLCEIDRDGRILRTRKPTAEATRFTTHEGEDVCRLPDALKRPYVRGPDDRSCPPRSEAGAKTTYTTFYVRQQASLGRATLHTSSRYCAWYLVYRYLRLGSNTIKAAEWYELKSASQARQVVNGNDIYRYFKVDSRGRRI